MGEISKEQWNAGMSAGEENNDIKSFKNREQISQMTLWVHMVATSNQ